ncbi:AraC family transcriptional regulator [Photobacterium atrarenae]|uniref:AraC family transcriptional regulator n=1 Tax=Photobacterium atrarenae TaxID=865757 RepID=A0ABY5GIC1_9GAMM|nr:AraC family transcriptional regulator [Photobacterium atrarenae]UTV29032.1 AraC family transcriptional regulator [Photobacterium atrarenae]
MKIASKFTISPNCKVLLKDMQLEITDVLRYARLPADLFQQPQAALSPLEYFQLWLGIEKAAGDREVPLLLAEHLSVESFDAPIFAAICSPNLNVALKRISQYKPLIGPMVLDVTQSAAETQLALHCYGYQGNFPSSLALAEMVFFTQLSRLATREAIAPIGVELTALPQNLAAYEAYFGCRIKQGQRVALRFRAEDAALPFLTSNAKMWDYFESSLNQQLSDLDASAGMVARVKAVLLEALPSGESSIEAVADRLAISKRTLQRKLTAEAASFQSVLQTMRTELADHYLEKSHLSLGEIAFLLGFHEPNSFIRAYSQWKGNSPGHYREQYLKHHA